MPYFPIEKDYERGYEAGKRAATILPINFRTEYQKGFDAGKKAASKDLFPSGNLEFVYKAE